MTQTATEPRQTGVEAAAKTWFITGASRGFGALVSEQALARGDNVVATARDSASVVSRFGNPPNLLAVALDVTDDAQAQIAAEAAITRFGRVDILLNNAGVRLHENGSVAICVGMAQMM